MNNIKERIKIFLKGKLKYIAFASMLIDHFNKAIIHPNLDGGMLNRISDPFDILGRIAFPIFIFLLIEGYFHTKKQMEIFRNSSSIWYHLLKSHLICVHQLCSLNPTEQYHVYTIICTCHYMGDRCIKEKLNKTIMVYCIHPHYRSYVFCNYESRIRL